MCQVKTVNICGIPYTIHEAPRDADVLKGEDGVRLCGRIFYEEAEIFIQEEMSHERKQRVIKHELAHGILFETQTSIKDEYTQEDLIEFMALYSETLEGLYQEYLAGCSDNIM